MRSPERNHNQSDVIVMMDSGAGIRITEAFGILTAMVLLPPDFNETYAVMRRKVSLKGLILALILVRAKAKEFLNICKDEH